MSLERLGLGAIVSDWYEGEGRTDGQEIAWFAGVRRRAVDCEGWDGEEIRGAVASIS